MGSGSTPVLNTSRSFIVLHDNFNLPERLLNASGTDTSGGVLLGVKATPLQLDTYITSCDGRMCDQSTLFSNGVLQDHCACMQMNKSGKVMVVMTLTLEQRDGEEFDVSFASKHFMLNFLLTGPFPMGTNASSFEHYEVEDRLWNAAESVFRYINENGGFRAFIWAKRGVVEDAGVDQPDGYGATRSTVESGILKRHVVRLEPMNPQNIDVEVLRSKQFDVTNGFKESVGMPPSAGAPTGQGNNGAPAVQGSNGAPTVHGNNENSDLSS